MFVGVECLVAHVRAAPQVILQTLLSKAEGKLKDGERILKEHENVDSAMNVSNAPAGEKATEGYDSNPKSCC